MAITLTHQTKDELIVRLRDAYKNASRDRLAVIARWLLARIAEGDVTDTQITNAFELTTVQWTTLKAKMVNLVASYETVQAAEGE